MLTTLTLLLIAAETAADLTLPMAVWVAIGAALTGAATYLMKSYKNSVESNALHTANLVRESVHQMTINNELLRQHAALLHELSELIRGLKNV